MGRYLPYKALLRESNQQAKRLAHGLKTGFYVKYPDPEKGPHVVRASKLPELNKEPKNENK
jgi:hypothetical protein